VSSDNTQSQPSTRITGAPTQLTQDAASGTILDLTGRKILVVDDDRLNVRILSNILKSEGYLIMSADTGEKGLEVYERFLPDLVLLDVMMPGINGYDTCRELRRRHGRETAPVIFVTAKNESDDVVEGFQAGGVDYLPKPFRGKEALVRIRTHLQMRILIKQQRSLVEQLQQANQAKNKFLGIAAHDLRNPLASIRGLAEFLQEGIGGELSAEQRDLVDTIHEASRSMLNMVNELLDVATIESGTLRIQPSPRNLAALLEKCVYLANIEAAKKHSHVAISPDSASPAQLNFDWDRMKQVLDNLISNGLKYSPPGSIITVRLTKEERFCTLSVLDQGPGIPESERHKLFKDFGQLSVKPTGGEKSTGLGLSICRKIVEAHKGNIIALNQSTGGCEFRVNLPLS
jgi:two-component system, sensor histidine kinase and response regulator